MEKFKKGDKFIPYKPLNDARWKRGMDKYEGHTFTVCDIIDCSDGLAIIALENNQMFLADWCEKVSNSEIPNDHIPDVRKVIDWDYWRNEFAKAAMQGMLAHPTRYKPRECDKDVHWHIAISREASDLADEMIKQLKQE